MRVRSDLRGTVDAAAEPVSERKELRRGSDPFNEASENSRRSARVVLVARHLCLLDLSSPRPLPASAQQSPSLFLEGVSPCPMRMRLWMNMLHQLSASSDLRMETLLTLVVNDHLAGADLPYGLRARRRRPPGKARSRGQERSSARGQSDSAPYQYLWNISLL